MRCIFCKTKSENSKSVEHIVPESLGNVKHILKPGIVCDKCNNYFARKLEKPLLESQYFLYSRFENVVPNKKRRIPIVNGFHPRSRSIVDVEVTAEGMRIIVNKADVPQFLRTSEKGGSLYVPHPEKPEENSIILSRFLGKVAIEALAQRALSIPNAIDVDIIDNQQLDELREYVRWGNKNIVWPYHQREIYPHDAMFYSHHDDEHYDIPHEYTLLYTDEGELYFVLAIFGIEYTINMGGLEIERYHKWIKNNAGKSPLYMDGMQYSFTRGTFSNVKKGSIIELCSRE